MERLAFETEFRTMERMVKRGNKMIEEATGECEMTDEEFLMKKGI